MPTRIRSLDAQLKKNVVDFDPDQFATGRKGHEPLQEASKEQFQENIGGGLAAQPTADACILCRAMLMPALKMPWTSAHLSRIRKT